MRIENNYVFFFRNKDIYSNWYKSTFYNETDSYCCMEQYMMHKKALLFGDLKTAEEIMNTSEPHEHKKLGRKVSNFNNEVWDKHKFNIVVNGLELKFSQNERLKKALLNTGTKTLVEASPYDRIWGVGLSMDDDTILEESNWKGQNLLGKALVKVRSIIAE